MSRLHSHAADPGDTSGLNDGPPARPVDVLAFPAWCPPVLEDPDPEPDRDECDACGGVGGWTWTVEGPDGRDLDMDTDCKSCDGTGWRG